MRLSSIYQTSLALLTDLYQLTMAYGYWKSDKAQHETVFNLFFRKPPFQSGFTVFCGLGQVLRFLEGFRFRGDDLAYLGGLTGDDGKALFEPAFLHDLGKLRLSCEIHAPPEGTVVFPHEPLLRVRGPILQCQILETALLNMVNFQTLIATKAARVALAAGDDPILEFGLRRAQGIDGGLSASYAAYVGGCAATSNVLAGKVYGIPVKGTHAHSWVMSFDDELEAFETYARAMPNNCVFLVDTYDTLAGVHRAVKVGAQLREKGFRMLGIRLDSGDLAGLSIAAREILDQAGFEDAAIVASNDLDEHAISDLKARGAKIGIWGVGTKLATAYDQPALGGVYKLAAIRRRGKSWDYKLKRSEEAVKTSNPGIQQIRRFSRDGMFQADVIYDEALGIAAPPKMFSMGGGRLISLSGNDSFQDLLEPVWAQGKPTGALPNPIAARERAQDQLRRFATPIIGRTSPETYPVGLEGRLYKLKQGLIQKLTQPNPEKAVP